MPISDTAQELAIPSKILDRIISKLELYNKYLMVKISLTVHSIQRFLHSFPKTAFDPAHCEHFCMALFLRNQNNIFLIHFPMMDLKHNIKSFERHGMEF